MAVDLLQKTDPSFAFSLQGRGQVNQPKVGGFELGDTIKS